EHSWVQALYAVLGYTRFNVSPNQVTMQWIRTGYSFEAFGSQIEHAIRDWHESWAGRQYAVDSPSSVTVDIPPKWVAGVRTVSGAEIPDFCEPPPGNDYYVPPGPLESEHYPPRCIPLDNFPEPIAVVDTVPELVYEVNFDIRAALRNHEPLASPARPSKRKNPSRTATSTSTRSPTASRTT
ncbi:unnamed protein product, partial [marine sediment metagenome]